MTVKAARLALVLWIAALAAYTLVDFKVLSLAHAVCGG